MSEKRKRILVKNKDGSYSSERSITVTDENGMYRNIPTMFKGKQVSPDEAHRIMKKNNYIDPDTGRISRQYRKLVEAVADAQMR